MASALAAMRRSTSSPPAENAPCQCEDRGSSGCGAERPHGARDLESETAFVVNSVDADARPAEDVSGLIPGGQASRCLVSGDPRCLYHPMIDRAVGKRERAAGHRKILLTVLLRAAKLVTEGRLVELGQPRVPASVGAHLPARPGELVPAVLSYYPGILPMRALLTQTAPRLPSVEMDT